MRVLQVNYAFDPNLASAAGLLDRYATLTGWAAALSRAGAEVATVQAFHSSANVTRMGLPYIFGDFATLAAAAAAFHADLVHVNGLGRPLRTWRLARRVAPAALVVQDHAGGDPSGGTLRRIVRRTLLRPVDAFLFTAVEQAEPWRRAGLIRAPQAVFDVLEASTDVRPLPQAAARAATGVSGDPAALWIGRLNANKDPLTVLDGFERVAARRAGAALTMIFQDGEFEDGVRARVAGSPVLRDRVRLAGRVPHDRIAAFCSAADLFVLGSHHEGSGYALLESMACGCVPVVTDIPSFRAIVRDEGVLWPPGDSESCARAMERAAAIPRQRVLDHFARNLTWEAVGKRAMKIYEEVVQRKRAAV